MSLPVSIQSNSGRANSLTDWTCEFVQVTQGTFDNSDSKKNAANLGFKITVYITLSKHRKKVEKMKIGWTSNISLSIIFPVPAQFQAAVQLCTMNELCHYLAN